MFLGGFILAVVTALIILVLFLSNLHMFSDMAAQGFSAWIQNFMTHFTAQKTVFFLAVVLFIVGVVCYLVGKKKLKKSGQGTAFVPEKIKKYFRDTRGEFRKVVWPTLPAVLRNTGVTLAVCAVLGLVICLFDAGLGGLIKLLLNITG